MAEGRWTRETESGEDPREVDAEHYDPDHVEHREKHRPVTNDQPAVGESGTSSDKPGVDGGGYPQERPPVQEPPD